MPEENSPHPSRSYIRHPRDLYRWLCAEAPVQRVVMWDGRPAWLVTRYVEAKAVLNDPRLRRNGYQLMDLLPSSSYGPRWSLVNSHMQQQDPPEHARLRKLITTALTPHSVQKIQRDIIRIADELLDGVAVAAAAGGTVDLVQLYAMPLALRVISKLLGVPAGEAEDFRIRIEPLLTSTGAPILGAIEYIVADLLDGLIAQKRVRPEGDLFSALVHMSDGEEQLSHDELVSAGLLLVLAGYDTSVHLICNGIRALLRNTSQLMAVRTDPSLLCGAVQEFLRFENPLNVATARFTTETVYIGDVEIPPGQLVLVGLLRSNDGCLGAWLARLEGEIAIGRLLDRFGRITLVDNALLRYGERAVMPGLTTLPVRVGA
ncbi:cytochrome P450 [Mycobacterium montefiorense]|nr:cytochrome P450 [Mycobacterium montefiorense]GKU42437.1 cytochrome P450 [Mycobacterium montefiorense]GKU58943.1 cytochrome P450 [Mycobacterium montefiorense]GKU64066.1 cytochrome P450 [Mycobacterium montefiorense]